MLRAVDVIAPFGEIEPSVFADESTVLDRVHAYLEQGYAALDTLGITNEDERDRLVRYYAYEKAFRAVATQLAGTLSGRLGEVSYNVLTSQVNFFNARADGFLAQWTEGTKVVTTTSTVQFVGAAVPTIVTW